MEELIKNSYFPELLSSIYGYNNLCGDSNEILGFKPPQKLSVRVLRCITPYFASSCDILLPTDRGVEVAICSEPIFLPNLQQLRGLQWENLVPYSIENPRRTVSHLLYGRLTENSKVDALYSCLISPNTLFTACGAGNLIWAARSNTPHFLGARLTLMNRWRSVNTYLSYTTRHQILGSSIITTVKHARGLSVGGEFFFSALDMAGTISLGFRYVHNGTGSYPPKKHQSSLTMLVNPIFGQIMSTFTCPLAPGLFSCLRYNFNVYSYEADLSLGLEYITKKNEEGLSPGSGYFSKVRLRLGQEIVLSLIYHPRQRLHMEFGLLVDPLNPLLGRVSLGIQLH